MLPLILFIALGLVVLVATEIHERHKSRGANDATRQSISNGRPEGCCGEHLVCERETLLVSDPQPEYYDDEELDALAGIEPVAFTAAQHDAVRRVFDTLSETDVAGWCRSLQLRQIRLPDDIREEALLIVREQRRAK